MRYRKGDRVRVQTPWMKLLNRSGVVEAQHVSGCLTVLIANKIQTLLLDEVELMSRKVPR